jgi:hypothetical protein
MDDLIKILLLILGFLLGVSGQIIVQLNTERRKKAAIRDLMRVEIQAFIEACEAAGKRKSWDSFSVENTCRYIIESYSRDRERFIAALKPTTRQGLYHFFLEVNGLLSLIEDHRKLPKIDTDGSTAAIGPGTYEGTVERSRALLEALK